MKYGGFVRMTNMCKSRVPQDIWQALDSVKDDAAAVKEYGIKFGVKLCQDLLASGLVRLSVRFVTLVALPMVVWPRIDDFLAMLPLFA